jgi:hypothetical protein
MKPTSRQKLQTRGHSIQKMRSESNASVPRHSPGLGVSSYAAFISAYAQGEGRSLTSRLPEPDWDAICEMLFPAREAEFRWGNTQFFQGFADHLALMSVLLTELAPLFARQARRLVKKGLLEPKGNDGQFAIAKTTASGTEQPVKPPREQRLEGLKARGNQARKVFQRLAGKRRTGHEPHKPGEVQTTARHARNYVGGIVTSALKEAGSLVPDGVSDAMPYLQGVGDLLSPITLAYHGVNMYGVLLKKLSASEKAKLGLVMKFMAAEQAQRALLAGTAPTIESSVSAIEFWATLSAWPDAAAVVAKVVRRFDNRRQRGTEVPTDMRSPSWMLKAKNAKTVADDKQATVGLPRDLLPDVAMANVARGAFEVSGHASLSGFLSGFGALAGTRDMPQGGFELEAADIAKAMSKARIARLTPLWDEAWDNPLHEAYLGTLLGYCQRKKRIAGKEQKAAVSRIVSGAGRIVAAEMSTILLAKFALGAAAVPVVAAAAPGLAYAIPVFSAAAMGFFGISMYKRQKTRADEERLQKWDERDNRAMRAIHSLDALRKAYLRGFSVQYGRGDLTDAEQGYAKEHTATYEGGANESMTVEMMAFDILENLDAGGREDSFAMKILRAGGFDPVSELLLRGAVLAQLHAGRIEEAHAAIANALRRTYDMPPARTAEAVQPQQFVSRFEVAESMAQALARARARGLVGASAEAYPAELARFMFSPEDERGLGVDRKTFLQSMAVLQQAFEHLGEHADPDGVYARMLAFKNQLQPEPAARGGAAERHLRTWTKLGETANDDWTEDCIGAYQHVQSLLYYATVQPGSTWRDQLQLAIDHLLSDTSEKARKRFCGVLAGELRMLAHAGHLNEKVTLLARDIVRELGQTAGEGSDDPGVPRAKSPKNKQKEHTNTPLDRSEEGIDGKPMDPSRDTARWMLPEIHELLAIVGTPGASLKKALAKRVEAHQLDDYIAACLDALDALDVLDDSENLTLEQNLRVGPLRKALEELRATRH